MSVYTGKLHSKMYRTLDNDTVVDIRAAGFPNCLYSFTSTSSASRIIMAGHHQGQTVTIEQPQMDRNFAGMEMNLKDWTIDDSRREQDCEILAIIPKYTAEYGVPVTSKTCPLYVVIVRNLGDNTLDYFEIKRYQSKVNGYGFFPQLLNQNRIRVGEIIPKEMEITPPPAVKGEMYGTGRNVVICFGTFGETIEDANIISESEANAMAIQRIYQVPITCSKEKRPVEIHGSGSERNPFPDIGTFIGADGIIHATRTVNWMCCTEDTDPDRLREVQPVHDNLFQGLPGGEILDLDFIGRSRNMPAGYEQAQRYMRNGIKFWKDIFQTYTQYKKNLRPTEKMEELVRDACYRLVLEGEQLPFLNDTHQQAIDGAEIEHPEKGKLDFLHATITYAKRRPFSPGDKLTLHVGGKSVSATVYPDHAMPVDKYGIRAGICMSMTSLFSRTIFGPYWECGMNRISEFVRRKVEAANRDLGPLAAYSLITEWMGDYNPNYRIMTERRTQTMAQKKALVDFTIKDGFYNFIPPFHENFSPSAEDRWNAIRKFKGWWDKWEVPSSPVTFKTKQRDGSFKEFTSVEEVGMGSAYVIHLKHIPRISSPGFASVGHTGIPCPPSGSAATHPVSKNPSRMGGDEQRVLLMHVDVKWVVRLVNLYGASPIKGTNFMVREMLNSDKPTAVEVFNVSNAELLSGSVILQPFHSTMATIGYNTRATAIVHPLPTDGLENFVDSLDELEDKTTEAVVKKTRGRRAGIRVEPNAILKR